MAEAKKTTLEDRWGEQVMQHGWVAVPVSLLLLQETLGISPNAMNVLLNLLSHWWGEENPYPSQIRIAKRMGVSKRTVQRSIQELSEANLIKKIPTKIKTKFNGRNIYDLTPLTKKLKELSSTLETKKLII